MGLCLRDVPLIVHFVALVVVALAQIKLDPHFNFVHSYGRPNIKRGIHFNSAGPRCHPMSKKKGKKKGIVGKGGESLTEAGSEHAGSDDRPVVGKGERVDDVSSANSSNHDKDEGSGNEGSSDPEWEDNEDYIESNDDDDDDDAVNLNAEAKDCNDDDANCNDSKRVPNIDWTIEGLDGLDDKQIRHSNAFYSLLRKWYVGKEYTSVLMTKESYDKIVQFLIYLSRPIN